VVNVALYVVALAGPVTECDAAPLSDQLANTYCVPAPPASVPAAIVCVDPGVHCAVHGDVHPTPSTVSDKPAGELATVTLTGDAVKPAVTDSGPLIVTFCGFVVPASAPENPLNWYPDAAVALTDTTDPALYHPVAGLIVPPATGLDAVVN
jgi:hypothetical protein